MAMAIPRWHIPTHLCLAAVTIVSYVGVNTTNLPNGNIFQFSTYFLDHLFVSGDAAHNVPPIAVPDYLVACNALEGPVFNFFGKGFPAVAFPAQILGGSYGDPTGPTVVGDEASIPNSSLAFPYSSIQGPDVLRRFKFNTL